MMYVYDRFTKTGSGQAQEKLRGKAVSAAGVAAHVSSIETKSIVR